MTVDFVKMEGAGNDFVVFDNRTVQLSDTQLAELAKAVCPRRRGVGADGLLIFSAADDGASDYRMRYLNRDGTVASMCGNGARCLAQYARHEAGMQQDELHFQSDAGRYRAVVPDDPGDEVRLYVQPPRRYQPEISLNEAPEAIDEKTIGPFHYIWPGVEHVVCFVDDIEEAPVATVGPLVRRDAALQPEGANVNFVEVRPEGLWARTYEKGVEAETLACGTGALAAACVARLQQRVGEGPVDVYMPGGELVVGGRLQNGQIANLYLEGSAHFVFRGQMSMNEEGE